jgi:ABC-type branched-subunit amino acid transport system substrate-binding protein
MHCSKSPNLQQCIRFLTRSAMILLLSGLMACGMLKTVSPTKPSETSNNRPTEYNTPSTSSNAGAQTVYDPIKREWITVQTRPNERIDTMRWKENNQPGPIKGGNNPATNSTNNPSNTPGTIPSTVPGTVPNRPNTNPTYTPPIRFNNQPEYELAVLLPFLAGQYLSPESSDNAVAEWAMQYYSGMKLALDQLGQEGMRLKVTVMDTKADTNEVYRLIRRPELNRAQLLIGPYKRDNIRILAEYAKRNGKPMISPYSAVGSLTRDNPNYVQFIPSLESHCRALLKDALAEFRPEDVVLVARNIPAEQACLEFLRKANRERGFSSIREVQVPAEDKNFTSVSLRTYLQGKSQVALIIPSWADETFIFYFLRAVRNAKSAGQNVVVYGMPQWMDYEQMELELYEQCKVRISQVSFLDDQSPELLNFRRSFYQAYGTIPAPEAVAGFDHTLYYGRLLGSYGMGFVNRLESSPGMGLHTRFEFAPITSVSTVPGSEQYGNVQRFENRYVHILEFANSQFRPLRRY